MGTDTSHPQLANCRARDGDKIFNWCCTMTSLEPYSDTLHTCTKFGDPIPTVPSAPAPAPVAVPVPVPVPVPDDSNVVAPTPTATGVCTPSLDPNCEKYGDGSVLYTCTEPGGTPFFCCPINEGLSTSNLRVNDDPQISGGINTCNLAPADTGVTPSPSRRPTSGPTKYPTRSPTNDPTRNPTRNPTGGPTPNPTAPPTPNPTPYPTPNPTPEPNGDMNKAADAETKTVEDADVVVVGAISAAATLGQLVGMIVTTVVVAVIVGPVLA